MARGENKRKMKKIGGNIGYVKAHRSHVSYDRYLRNRKTKYFLDKNLEWLRKKFCNDVVE